MIIILFTATWYSWVILNMCFLRRGVVSTSPNPQAGGPPLVGCLRLLIQFIHSYPPYWRPFLHPQPEDAPCRGDRDPVFGPERDEVTGEWRKLRNEELNDLYSLPRGHCGDQDLDGRIILRWIFRKLEGVVGTGCSWLRIGKGGGHLWVRWETFGFHKCGEFLD
jgi:hypothetical protein